MKIFYDEIFAVVAPGLEAVCARELTSILGRPVEAGKGGVIFSGSLEDLYRVNLGSRTASRFLVRVGEVRATDFPELYRKVKRLPWGRFVRPETAVTVRCTSRKSRLNHTGRIAEAVSDAINGALGRSVAPAAGRPQLIVARLENDTCQLSVDSSGELLYRRGYRTEVSRAPLRETLAAGILHLLGWDGSMPLYDPMCGSGTLLIEGALIAAGIAPGSRRSFAFQNWPRYRDGLWRNLLLEAERLVTEPKAAIAGSDSDAEIIAVARRNAERAGVGEMVRFAHLDIGKVQAPGAKGLIVCNPPYGLRIGAGQTLTALYRQIGDLYAQRFDGWRGALFCPAGELAVATGLNLDVVAELDNGGVATMLFCSE